MSAGDGVIFFGARRALLLLHAGSSIVFIGAATHHALQRRHYFRGRFQRQSLEKTYAKVVSVTYVLTFLLGAMVYPSYRVHVRGYYLDRFAPAYSSLFDLKEVYASLTLTVAVGLGALAFTLKPDESPALARIYATMSLFVCAVVWFDVIAGLLITSVRGLG